VLAATLSPSYGIYSGYEHCENVPVREGSEEYLNSEKYELKSRRLDGPLLPLVRRLNEIRRAEPALQRFENLRFVETRNEELLGYLKEDVVVVVNLDPFASRDGVAVIEPDTGFPPEFRVTDLLSGERYRWRLGRNYVGLPPGGAHVLKVEA
jgi:starch synthase (maltosyl-transferring)